MKGETKTIYQNSTFFISLFFLKIQDIKKPKHQFLERDSINFWGVKCLPFFKQAPLYCNIRLHVLIHIYHTILRSSTKQQQKSSFLSQMMRIFLIYT